ncbi:hypothetical protein E4M02_05795 [Brevundimonas sp. S30B]|uniref:hypothetical protein n=1 Tax=unclassified Brevundimonas TaxID=2622653 RepID=UPI0010719511|nr:MULTISPECIES: hypothetical protein [unclassified Brevundimonas]QBX36630.1 hypothetical protein E4M01_02020 [Brevundimonas sp. MF30-B]TFW04575.1 hypothetical protein E4M02_05795 [Brevundimonas sp. S30B]
MVLGAVAAALLFAVGFVGHDKLAPLAPAALQPAAPQPRVVDAQAQEIEALLAQASWVSLGGAGATVHILAHRHNETSARFLTEMAPRLADSGAEVRVTMFAPTDRDGVVQSTKAERATVAELWLTRDPALLERWLATDPARWTAAGLPSADEGVARTDVVDQGRRLAARLEGLFSAAGGRPGYPLVIWRGADGRLRACSCSDQRSWAVVLEDRARPDPAPTPMEAVPAAPPAPRRPAPPVTPAGQPYPDLPPPKAASSQRTSEAPAPAPAPRAQRSAPPPPAVAARPQAEPPARRESRPAPGRARPEAKRQDDSLFF